MPIERIQAPGLQESQLYSHVVRDGNTVYLAGQVARNGRGELVGPGDFTAQAEQVIANLRTALKSVGGDLSNLVKVTIYITDPRYRDPLREINLKYLSENKPVSTLLVVAGLAQPEVLIEIDGIAVLD